MWDFLDNFMIWGEGVGVYYVCLFLMLSIPEMKEWRNKLVFPNLFLLFLIVNPVIYELIWYKIFGITFHRINMCFPIAFVIAYVLVYFWSQAKEKLGKLCAFIGILLIMLMGYNTIWEDLSVKTNIYGLSEDVVAVSDHILEESSEACVMAADPDFNFFRQYTSKIRMLYGENISQDKMEGRDVVAPDIRELYAMMEEEQPDMSGIFPLAFENGVDYIVINTEKHQPVNAENSEYYNFVIRMGKYDLYKKTGEKQ